MSTYNAKIFLPENGGCIQLISGVPFEVAELQLRRKCFELYEQGPEKKVISEKNRTDSCVAVFRIEKEDSSELRVGEIHEVKNGVRTVK